MRHGSGGVAPYAVVGGCLVSSLLPARTAQYFKNWEVWDSGELAGIRGGPGAQHPRKRRRE